VAAAASTTSLYSSTADIAASFFLTNSVKAISPSEISRMYPTRQNAVASPVAKPVTGSTLATNYPPQEIVLISPEHAPTFLTPQKNKMQNENGENVDLYVPRKCNWSNRLVEAKDHSSVQINIANVDPVTGLATGDATPFCLVGYIRDISEGDMALTELVKKNDAAMSAVEE